MELFFGLFEKVFILFSENPLGQSLGFIAMFIGISGYMVTDDKKTIKIFIASNIAWILHFVFLVNYGALAATAVGLLRLILSLKYQKNISVFMGIIALILAVGIYSFDGEAISMLPLIATAVSSYGFFFLEKIRLRILLAAVSMMWLMYHLGTGSISGIANEIIVQCTILYSVVRFATGHEKKQKMLERFKARIGKAPIRVNFGRYIYFRDKDRFE